MKDLSINMKPWIRSYLKDRVNKLKGWLRNKIYTTTISLLNLHSCSCLHLQIGYPRNFLVVEDFTFKPAYPSIFHPPLNTSLFEIYDHLYCLALLKTLSLFPIIAVLLVFAIVAVVNQVWAVSHYIFFFVYVVGVNNPDSDKFL